MINKKQLKHRCMQSDEALIGKDRYKFFDNGGDVLAIAHVDVAPSIKKVRRFFKADGDLIYSPSLDDRLGVYLLLDLFPSLGLNFDVLLTTDEEIGQSTAADFVTEKKYNWIFQFDRNGVDVVMYEYDTKENRQLLADHGFNTGIGSFSDICYLERFGVTGFNFGTGYHNEHSINCHMVLFETEFMVDNFVRFFNDLHKTKLVHTPEKYDIDDGYFTIDNYPYYVDDDVPEKGQAYWDYDPNNPPDFELCDYCQVGDPERFFDDLDCVLCANCIEFLGLK